MALGKNVSLWGTKLVVTSRQDIAILPARVANHSAGVDLSSPFDELVIQ